GDGAGDASPPYCGRGAGGSPVHLGAVGVWGAGGRRRKRPGALADPRRPSDNHLNRFAATRVCEGSARQSAPLPDSGRGETVERECCMDWLQALILGVVEGLTEYLPVSSTAHLLLAQRALGVGQSEASDAYAICIQAGAIAAVLGLYARRVGQMLRGLAGRDPEGLRLAVNVVVAFLPAMVFGLLFN